MIPWPIAGPGVGVGRVRSGLCVVLICGLIPGIPSGSVGIVRAGVFLLGPPPVLGVGIGTSTGGSRGMGT